jgi:hypothetical protein
MPTAAGIESLARRSENLGQSQIGGTTLEPARRFANESPGLRERYNEGQQSAGSRLELLLWRRKIGLDADYPSHQTTIIPELPSMKRQDSLMQLDITDSTQSSVRFRWRQNTTHRIGPKAVGAI